MHRSVFTTAVMTACLVIPQVMAQEPTRSLDELLAALEASSEATRAEAAATINKLGQDALPALLKMLDDPSPDTRSTAANALGLIGIDDEAVIAALLIRLDDAELRSDDMPVWGSAARAIGQLGPKSVPRLIAKLSADNRTGRRAAAIALHDIKPPPKNAVPALIVMLIQNEPETRIAAMYTILALDPKPAASAMSSLHAMLDSDDFHTQYWACRTIAAVGAPEALVTVPKLMELTASGVTSVRSNAAEALGLIGAPVGKRPIESLTKVVGDQNYVVRRAGVIALGRLGKLAAASAPTVRAAMLDASRSIQAEAAAALWQITDAHEESLPILLKVLQDHNAPWEAAQAFERLGAAGQPAVADLAKLVEAAPGETQYFATLALSGIGPAAKDALPALRKLLESPDEDMRQVAKQVIEHIGGE